MKSTKNKEWEKEFNKKWPNTAGTFCSLKSRDSVMEFIRSLLSSQKQEIIKLCKEFLEEAMKEEYYGRWKSSGDIADLIEKIKQL